MASGCPWRVDSFASGRHRFIRHAQVQPTALSHQAAKVSVLRYPAAAGCMVWRFWGCASRHAPHEPTAGLVHMSTSQAILLSVPIERAVTLLKDEPCRWCGAAFEDGSLESVIRGCDFDFGFVAANHEHVRMEVEEELIPEHRSHHTDAHTSASLLPPPSPSPPSSSSPPPSTEQSAYMALQAKGALQPHRPTLQSFSSSFMGGSYLARAIPPISRVSPPRRLTKSA